MPKYLFPENEAAIHLWRVCHFHSRPYGAMGGIFPLPMTEIESACNLYDTAKEDFEKMLIIEQNVFPFLQEHYNEKNKKNETPEIRKRK